MPSSHSGSTDPNVWTCTLGWGWDGHAGKGAGDEKREGRAGNNRCAEHSCCGGGGGADVCGGHGGGAYGGEGVAYERKLVSGRPHQRMKVVPERPRFLFLTGVMPVRRLFPPREGNGDACWMAARFGRQNCQTGSGTLRPSPPSGPVFWP